MNISDIINLILACSTITLASISTIILIVSINQNKRALENSTRPSINIYGIATYFSREKEYFFIIKNYGATTGKILSISADTDLSTFALDGFSSPFSFISGLTLSPNQSYSIALNKNKFKNFESESISITVVYEGNNKKYTEKTLINVKYLQKSVVTKWDGKPLDVISGTLQDMAKRNL